MQCVRLMSFECFCITQRTGCNGIVQSVITLSSVLENVLQYERIPYSMVALFECIFKEKYTDFLLIRSFVDQYIKVAYGIVHVAEDLQ